MSKNKNILDKIYSSIERFLAPLTLEETYKIIIDEGIKLTGAKYGSVFLKSKNGGFKRAYSSIPKTKRIIPQKKGYSYNTYKTGKLKILTKDKIILHHPELKNLDIKYVVFVPLSHQKKSLGTLNFQFYQKKPLTKEKLDILNILGPLASLIIRKMQYYHELEMAIKSRDLFIALASHELKTPLTSANIYAQLIHSKFDKKETIEHKLMDNFMMSFKRLVALINDFLHVESIKKGQLNYSFKRSDMKKFLIGIVSDFRNIYIDYNINFRNKLPGNQNLLNIDSDKLSQAIGNLLNNAIKFSPKGSTIYVSLSYKDNNVIIDIIDKGAGINKKDLNKIFDPFYKGQEEKPGMGLGLYLTKKIIAEHQGTITVFSKINQGATFRITLPSKKILYEQS